ncbi:hypothetical protein D3C74_306070 [compost metagenome]
MVMGLGVDVVREPGNVVGDVQGDGAGEALDVGDGAGAPRCPGEDFAESDERDVFDVFFHDTSGAAAHFEDRGIEHWSSVRMPEHGEAFAGVEGDFGGAHLPDHQRGRLVGGFAALGPAHCEPFGAGSFRLVRSFLFVLCSLLILGGVLVGSQALCGDLFVDGVEDIIAGGFLPDPVGPFGVDGCEAAAFIDGGGHRSQDAGHGHEERRDEEEEAERSQHDQERGERETNEEEELFGQGTA